MRNVKSKNTYNGSKLKRQEKGANSIGFLVISIFWGRFLAKTPYSAIANE
jgi:hypothetical protein